jgi:hypothetical protein
MVGGLTVVKSICLSGSAEGYEIEKNENLLNPRHLLIERIS